MNRHCSLRSPNEVDRLLNTFDPRSSLHFSVEVGHEPITTVVGPMEAGRELVLIVRPERSNDKIGTATDYSFYWTVAGNGTVFNCCLDLVRGLGSGALN